MADERNHNPEAAMSAELRRAPQVRPRAITGAETPAELLATAFPAYVGRQVRTGYELMARSVNDNHTVFLTLSGAMTPAGLHSSCIIPLVERGIVDVITTTGANIYHDAHRVIGHAIHEISPTAGDRELRRENIIRIYDLGFTEATLLDTDRLFANLLRRPEVQRAMTTVELHYYLGEQMAALEAELGVTEPCLLSSCYRAGVPIFVGAPQDGSIFLNAVKLRALLGDEFGFSIDAIGDVYQMAALQWLAQSQGKTAVWILGGGVPKNYTLQGEPTLSQILGVDARGFDVDLQFCVDPVDNGALSSCPAGEGHTWGKVSVDCMENASVYVHCDMTAVLPWLVHALFAAGAERAPRRWYDRLGEARGLLDDAVAANRDQLLADLEG
jgi:deoxyhypusine synthase